MERRDNEGATYGSSGETGSPRGNEIGLKRPPLHQPAPCLATIKDITRARLCPSPRSSLTVPIQPVNLALPTKDLSPLIGVTPPIDP
jgi:hypothetical protein